MADDSVDVKLARIEERLAVITAQLAQLSAHLLGVDGKPGIVVRLDRIEQAEAKRSKFMWIAIATAVAALGKSFL